MEVQHLVQIVEQENIHQQDLQFVQHVHLEHMDRQKQMRNVYHVHLANIHRQEVQVAKRVKQENIVVQVQQVVQHVLLELIQLQDHPLVQNAKQVSIPA